MRSFFLLLIFYMLTVSSLLPTSLQSFHSFVEFLEIVYFSVFDSFTNRFLSSILTSEMIVSIFLVQFCLWMPSWCHQLMLIQREYNVFCWFVSVITEVVWKQWIFFNGCFFVRFLEWLLLWKKGHLLHLLCGDPIIDFKSLPVGVFHSCYL